MPNSGRTLICSVLFLDIVEYSKRPVEEQIALKQKFNEFLTGALNKIAPRDRIILDTGDGAAVTFPGDPEDALFTAVSLRDTVGSLPVRLGINLGPVRLVRDINRQTSIIGDGINVAQRVMGFAAPGQLLVSRSFFEVVSCLSREYESLFRYEGSRTDKHVREHEIYSIVPDTPEARHLIDTALRAKLHARRAGWFSAPGPLGLRRGALVAAPLAFLLSFGAAIGMRAGQEPAPPEPEEAEAAAAAPAAAPAAPAPAQSASAEKPVAPAAKPAAGAARPAERTAPRRTERKPVAAPAARKQVASAPPEPPPAPSRAAPAAVAPAEAEPPAAREPVKRAQAERVSPREPALIHLAVAPWGEVFVDGQSRGVSPPLRSVEVSPGPHTVEIRNASFRPHVERIEVRSGDQVRIRHKFQ